MDKIKLFFGLAALTTGIVATGLAAGPAMARDVTVVATLEDGVPVARVSFADLDLATGAGRQTLHGRIGGAIRTVCAPAYRGLETNAYAECQNAAWDEARPQVASAVARAGRIAAGTATAQDRALAQTAAIAFGGQ